MQASVSVGSTTSFSLREALLIYRKDARGYNFDSEAFVTRHQAVVDAKGVPSLNAGELLPKDFLSSLVREMTGKVPVELLPQNVLIRTADQIVWHVAPQQRPMFYLKDRSPELEALSGKIFPQPALLFRVNHGALSIRALHDNERPTLTTPLFRAPYWNVNDGGEVCLGSTKVPEDLSIDTLARWEASFFESEFSHQNGQQKLTKHPAGFMGLWKALAGKKTFPAQYLAKSGETLAQFLDVD
jgi:PRTRC genetic system protein B